MATAKRTCAKHKQSRLESMGNSKRFQTERSGAGGVRRRNKKGREGTSWERQDRIEKITGCYGRDETERGGTGRDEADQGDMEQDRTGHDEHGAARDGTRRKGTE